MSNDTADTSNPKNNTEPDTDELQVPSTEKAPGDEPTSPVASGDAADGGGAGDDAAGAGAAGAGADADADEPSHEAVGIGVIGAPLVDPEQVDNTEG